MPEPIADGCQLATQADIDAARAELAPLPDLSGHTLAEVNSWGAELLRSSNGPIISTAFALACGDVDPAEGLVVLRAACRKREAVREVLNQHRQEAHRAIKEREAPLKAAAAAAERAEAIRLAHLNPGPAPECRNHRPETRDQRIVNDALRSRGVAVRVSPGYVPHKPDWEVR